MGEVRWAISRTHPPRLQVGGSWRATSHRAVLLTSQVGRLQLPFSLNQLPARQHAALLVYGLRQPQCLDHLFHMFHLIRLIHLIYLIHLILLNHLFHLFYLAKANRVSGARQGLGWDHRARDRFGQANFRQLKIQLTCFAPKTWRH